MNCNHFVLMRFFSPPLTPESVIMGMSNFSENILLLNYFPLIFEYYVCNARANGNLSIELLKRISIELAILNRN